MPAGKVDRFLHILVRTSLLFSIVKSEMDISGQVCVSVPPLGEGLTGPKPPPAFIIPFLDLAKKRSEERAKAQGKYKQPTMTVDGIEYVFYIEEDGRTNFRPVGKEDEWNAIGGGGVKPVKQRYSGGLEIPRDISGFGEYFDEDARDRGCDGSGNDKTPE